MTTPISTKTPRKPFSWKLAGAILAGAALGLMACGDPAPLASAETVQPAATSAQAPAATTIDASAGVTEFGDVLVGPNGMTLYGFTNDLDGRSACYGTCAEAWPPVIVGPNWGVAPAIDAGIFNTVARDDGQLQLVAGKWPLYYYAGDAIPGDATGQANGDVWFVVDLEGGLIRDTSEAAAYDEAADVVAPGASELGQILVDEAGLSLYGFLNDAEGMPSCFDACADAWPPLLVPSGELPVGLDPAVFSVVPYGDGFQLKAGKWPLYRFAADGAPGDINGQGSGDVWFLARPDGGLIMPNG